MSDQNNTYTYRLLHNYVACLLCCSGASGKSNNSNPRSPIKVGLLKRVTCCKWKAAQNIVCTLQPFKGHFVNKQAHCMNPNKEYHDLDLVSVPDSSCTAEESGTETNLNPGHSRTSWDSILECRLRYACFLIAALTMTCTLVFPTFI